MTQTNVPLQLHAIGHVVPLSIVNVQSRVDGTLDEVHFKDGDTVKQGELIFTIDPRPFQAALDQAKANLEKSIALAKNAEIEERRNAELLTNNIVSREVYDQSVANANSLRAGVVADRAAVANAELQLSYCYIRSPINGRAGTVQVNAGNTVKSQTTGLATLTQTKPVYVDFSLPEQQLGAVRGAMQQTSRLRVEAQAPGAEQISAGELIAVNNTVDTNTGTILLRAEFANDDEALWPGQFVNARVTLRMLSNAVVVPSQSVQSGQQGDYIFVVKPDATVESRAVETGTRVGGEVVLAKGAHAGEVVVTSGQARLAPGTRVRVQGGTQQLGGGPQHNAGVASAP